MQFLRSLDASPLVPDPDPARAVRLVAALESATVSVVTIEDLDATTESRVSPVALVLFVLEGGVTVEIGEHTVSAPADTLVYVPAMAPHRVGNAGSGPARYLVLAVPGIPPGRTTRHGHGRRRSVVNTGPSHRFDPPNRP